MKKLGRFATASSVILLLIPLAVAQRGKLTPTDLGTLGGTFSEANGLNGARIIVGNSSTTGDAATHAFYVCVAGAGANTTGGNGHICGTNSKGPHDIGALSGGVNSFAAAVNNAGQVVGKSEYADPLLGTVLRAFLYSRQGISDLGTLGGSQSQGNGVNSAGVVVGSSDVDDTASHAFWWDPQSKAMHDLGTLGAGTNSAAFGINSHNWAAGSSDTGVDDAFGNPISHAVIWDIKHNTKTDLPTLGGSLAQANAINDYGVAAGFSTTSEDPQTLVTDAFVYKNGHTVNIKTLGGNYAVANAVNNFGIVVGSSNIAGNTDVHAFMWTKRTGMLDLNSLLPANSGWVLNAASGITDEGRIVGVGTLSNGEAHAFALDLFADDDLRVKATASIGGGQLQ